MKKNLVFTLLSSAIALMIALPSIALPAVRGLPNAAAQCIPETAARYRVIRAELRGNTKYQGVAYYLLEVFPQGYGGQFTSEALAFPMVVSLQSDKCSVVFSSVHNDPAQFRDFVPGPVANQFDRIMPEVGRPDPSTTRSMD